MVNHIYKFASKCHSQTTPSRSGDSQGQKTFLALSAGMQSQNFDTRVLKPPFLPVNTKLKGIELQEDEMLSHIYKFTNKSHSQSTPCSEGRYPRPGNVFSTLKQTCNYDTRVLKLLSLPINTKVKGVEPQQDEMVSHTYKSSGKCHSQTTPSLEWR